MARSRKGKRRASSSEPFPFVEDADHGPSTKRSRLQSPERIKLIAKAKLASKLGSSSKGLAGLASLVNDANLAVARGETNRGLRSTSFSKGSRSGPSTQSHEDKQVCLVLMFMIKFDAHHI